MKNFEEFEKAKKLIDDGYYKEAEKILKKLQKQEPTSSLIKYELGHLWIVSGKSPERGEKYLLKLLENDSQAAKSKASLALAKISTLKHDTEKSREYYKNILNSNRDKEKVYALMELAFIEIREENYQKAYELIKEAEKYNVSEVYGVEYYQTKNYVKYKLGMTNLSDDLKSLYFYSQMLDYSEEKAIDHIKNHLNDNEDKRIHSIFADNADIDGLYHDARINIQYLNQSGVHLMDKYVLDHGTPIGTVNGTITSSVLIVAFPNTNDIITMYPACSKKIK